MSAVDACTVCPAIQVRVRTQSVVREAVCACLQMIDLETLRVGTPVFAGTSVRRVRYHRDTISPHAHAQPFDEPRYLHASVLWRDNQLLVMGGACHVVYGVSSSRHVQVGAIRLVWHAADGDITATRLC
jgi:hypothetical protein